MAVYLQLALAALLNVGTIYCLKKADGFMNIWPTFFAVISIILVQWLVSRVMAGGTGVGYAIIAMGVGVMIGSAFIGVFFFNENLSSQKIIGFGIAITGIVVASLAKT